MSGRIIQNNSLANRCGYFHNAYLTDGITANNGYNCRHPKQEEQCTEKGKIIGCCYAFSCPLGYEADKEDWERFGLDPDEYEAGEYVVVDTDKLAETGIIIEDEVFWSEVILE